MRTVTQTALANVKQNKGRNILSGIAIALTTLLIFIVLTVGYSAITIRSASVNKVYPTWHMMFRNVSYENAEALKLHEEIKTPGLRSDFGQIMADDAEIIMIAMDDTALTLNKVELESGNFPKKDNEIAVSQGLLDELGIQADIGDEITLSYQLSEKDGLGYGMEETFYISGFMAAGEENIEKKQYGALLPMQFMEERIPPQDRDYRVMFRLSDTNGMTVSEIKDKGKAIGNKFGIPEADVVDNGEYLAANYVEPSTVFVISMIVLIVIFAGILTIYSIYYVSMVPKVQEYGKLKAVGATKKQIRQIVFREGVIVAAIAVPSSLLISSLISKAIVIKMYSYSKTGDQLIEIAQNLIVKGEVKILYLPIYVITIAAAAVTMFLSLMKPMRTAAKISPVEAMRYGGGKQSRKKERSGHADLNLLRLTKANLSRNKKRTFITILTLGATGVLFMIAATILSCAKPEEIAKVGVESDYRIFIQSVEGDKMHPEQEWSKIQQNNPMDDEFINSLKEVPGVEKVRVKKLIGGKLPEYEKEGETKEINIKGFDESYAREIEKGLVEGDVTYDELKKGGRIIMNANLLRWIPDIKLGDTLKIELERGDETVEKSFEVAAIGKYTVGFCQEDFLLPQEVLSEINPYNLNQRCEITVDKNGHDETYRQLEELAGSREYLETYSYEQEVDMWTRSMELISIIGYAFLVILGGISIMNLINTMINSIYMRKRELGMMQAIGMSEKQLIRMLQMEGIFYTLGTLFVSIGAGSIAGYGVFLYAREEGLFSITTYHYPFAQTIILAAIVAALQILLTYMTSGSFRKLSLIDRIRYAE